ncbi:MgtC/SapB family protein [Jannaschia sp. W003]|uniref:MgtC/SapB family protein n=1 Tax=Jannaschia sp. W003 TaxID=2867012 RepID=UPI0021A86811|nr:MgtC/SapB family protein [Jannaschia sp. W003]UWQ23006.1 MgtC/SapB family protein [Jannaschia sp. W003]
MPVVAARMLAALVLGAVIGFEREWRDKPAGLRTHMLVAAAAALFVIVGQQLGTLHLDADVDKRMDPLRLIEAVTSGVAFLAAGVIFTQGGKVRHLTTGASMWMAGAIGLACGAGQMPVAALATALVVLVMVCVRQLEKWMGTYD